jgi:acetylornithine deacetylase/succinyl-diaminopimelate desuccinylase-like protein
VSAAGDAHRHPAALLQALIRFDTTNPPGNEAPAAAYLEQVLAAAGFETELLARDPARPNLLARLSGRGETPPLLMYGHLDVVTTAGQAWTVPPFEGRIVDGCVWGRGALDCKGQLAMMVAALLRARDEGLVPTGDVLFAATADEEVDTGHGVGYLVEAHAGRFEGVRYAISEVGGFTYYLGGARLYPIMVAEKQTCNVEVTLRGPGGHGSVPVRGGAMARLGEVLRCLDRRRLPVHVTPVAREMVEAVAAALGGWQGALARLLLVPPLTDIVLGWMGAAGDALAPLLHNTASATMVQASHQINVIPGEVGLRLDGRLLPGFAPEDMLRELRAILGDGVEIAVTHYEPGTPPPDMGLFDTLAAVLREADPAGTPMPLLMSGVTDARHLARLGIQTYGFTPMKLPPGLDFWKLVHGADERVPVEALEFGAACLYDLLQRF